MKTIKLGTSLARKKVPQPKFNKKFPIAKEKRRCWWFVNLFVCLFYIWRGPRRRCRRRSRTTHSRPRRRRPSCLEHTDRCRRTGTGRAGTSPELPKRTTTFHVERVSTSGSIYFYLLLSTSSISYITVDFVVLDRDSKTRSYHNEFPRAGFGTRRRGWTFVAFLERTGHSNSASGDSGNKNKVALNAEPGAGKWEHLEHFVSDRTEEMTRGLERVPASPSRCRTNPPERKRTCLFPPKPPRVFQKGFWKPHSSHHVPKTKNGLCSSDNAKNNGSSRGFQNVLENVPKRGTVKVWIQFFDRFLWFGIPWCVTKFQNVPVKVAGNSIRRQSNAPKIRSKSIQSGFIASTETDRQPWNMPFLNFDWIQVSSKTKTKKVGGAKRPKNQTVGKKRNRADLLKFFQKIRRKGRRERSVKDKSTTLLRPRPILVDVDVAVVDPK